MHHHPGRLRCVLCMQWVLYMCTCADGSDVCIMYTLCVCNIFWSHFCQVFFLTQATNAHAITSGTDHFLLELSCLCQCCIRCWYWCDERQCLVKATPCLWRNTEKRCKFQFFQKEKTPEHLLVQHNAYITVPGCFSCCNWSHLSLHRLSLCKSPQLPLSFACTAAHNPHSGFYSSFQDSCSPKLHRTEETSWNAPDFILSCLLVRYVLQKQRTTWLARVCSAMKPYKVGALLIYKIRVDFEPCTVGVVS